MTSTERGSRKYGLINMRLKSVNEEGEEMVLKQQ